MATGVGVEFDEYGRSIVGVIDWCKRFYSGEYQGVTLPHLPFNLLRPNVQRRFKAELEI